MNKVIDAIRVIRKKHKLGGKGIPRKDIVGEIKCLACSQVLRYSISSYNGHVWGKCETRDCLAWMM